MKLTVKPACDLFLSELLCCYQEKLRGDCLVFEIGTKRGSMKKLLRNRGLVEREGPLKKRKVSKLFHPFSFSKSCFHYYWIIFSGKYSHLLYYYLYF